MADVKRDSMGYVEYGSHRPGTQLEAVRVVIELYPDRIVSIVKGQDAYYNEHCSLFSKRFVTKAESDARLLEERLPVLLKTLPDLEGDVQIRVEKDWILQPGGEIPRDD